MNRVAEVNRALKLVDAQERLRRGKGYYYFDGGDASSWPATAVYVFRADELSVDEWLKAYEALKGAR